MNFLSRFFSKASPFFVALLSLLLFELAQPGIDYSACAWFFIVPAALAALRKPSWGKWLFVSWLSCWAAGIVLLIWLRWLYPPLGWVAVFGLPLIYSAFYWAWFAALRALFPLCNGRRALWQRVLLILGLAGLWILIEWVLTWIFTGFPWMPLAATQYAFPALLTLCGIGGQGLLGGVLVLVNLGIARYIQRQFFEMRDRSITDKVFPAFRHFLRVCPEIYMALLPVFAAIGIFAFKAVDYDFHHDEKFAFAAVQTDFDPNEKWDFDLLREHWRTICDLTASVSEKADFVLWPEAALPFPLNADGVFENMLKGESSALGTALVAGVVVAGEGGYYNAVTAVDPRFGISDYFVAKRHLVPFGEYVPLADILPLRKIVPVASDCLRGNDFAPLPVRLKNNRVLHLGVLVCYEDVFPELGRRCVAEGADALAVVTNDAWYGREAGAYQHMAHSVMQAVSLGVPVVRCGNAGWSGWISPLGQIFPMTDGAGSIYFRGAQLFHVSGWSDDRGGKTFFARHGNAWLLWAALFFVLVAAGLKIFLRRGDF
ncbi:MAG: apolipoprotein N-acyltransferase [Opitutales bacterium]|nr:apolipoprotein N-acyltransferase [Opitutales bacterium]